MRPIERIEVFQKLDISLLSARWGIDLPDDLFNEDVIAYWTKYYDMRVGQMLINYGVVEDVFDIWIDEDIEMLNDFGCDLTGVLYWGSVFTPSGFPTGRVDYKLVKDLETEHIHNIFDYMDKKEKPIYPPIRIALELELKKRDDKED